MARRTNGEGSAKWVVKNGVKYWRITITTGYDPLTGKQLRKDIYGKTQKEAKEKLRAFQESNTIHSDNSTLGNFFYEWLWNIKKQELKASTFDRIEGIYRNYIKPTKSLNSAKLTNIDTLYLQKITNKLLENHSVNQVKNLNKALNNCFKYALSINKIKSNPVTGIVYPKTHEVIEEKINYITEKEQQDLIKALQGDKCEGIILLGLMCGMRLGEAMALQENDIDFDNKLIFYKEHGEYIDNKQPNRRLKSALKRAGIEADINVTMKIYAEINKEKNLKEYEKINTMFK